ncbi:Os06g0670000, partial [Oryza sativa Japonica Group]
GTTQHNNKHTIIPSDVSRLNKANALYTYQAGHVCWDDNDIINGKPTGAVRISFGYMSTFEDAEVRN